MSFFQPPPSAPTTRLMSRYEGDTDTLQRGRRCKYGRPPLVPEKYKVESFSKEAWAARIKEVTSRLSRPTIASRMKMASPEVHHQDIKTLDFWNKMAYCSNQYHKKFDSTLPQVQPTNRTRSALTNRTTCSYAPRYTPNNGSTSGNRNVAWTSLRPP